MKRKINLILVLSILFFNSTFSQSDIAGFTGHVGTNPAWYVGWDAATTFPLNIRHNGVQRINFMTGGAIRMTVLGTNAGGNAGNVGIGILAPDMPLCINGGASDVTTSGWRRGIHLFNHAVIAWASVGIPGSQALFMGHPNFGTDQSFYCGLATNTGPTGVPNYVYRIVDIPTAGTSPNTGDMNLFHYLTVADFTTPTTGDQRIGVNTLNPQASVHINAPVSNTSGLRLEDLTSGSPAGVNPGPGVLAVDASGDVIYVTSPPTSQFGQDCTTPGTPGQLTVNRKLPMNNFNFYFEGQNAVGQNSVGIGWANCPNIPAKLSVLETGTGSTQIAVQGWSQGAVNCFGGDFQAQSGNGNGIGVNGTAVQSGGSSATGGQFKGTGAAGTNYGVNATASGGTTSYGLRSFASGGTGANYAVFATCLPSSGSTPPTGPNYAGWFDGDVVRTGTDNFSSDATLKTDIDSIYNALSIINQLVPRTFYFDSTNAHLMLPGGFQYGFIAQEVEPILPELVSTLTYPAKYDSAGTLVDSSFNFKGLNYQAFIPIMMKGIQEQQNKIEQQDSTIDALQQQIDDIMAMVSNCCGQGNSLQTPNNNTHYNSTYNVVHNTDVRLSDTYCVLGENSPNPFKDHTVINYTLSETIKSAQIVFYNTLGQVIKVLEIQDRGEGRLNVYAEDLRSGMYTYSLIVDGNVCESKKMIKE